MRSKRWYAGWVSSSGLKVIQISLPGSRMVGIRTLQRVFRHLLGLLHPADVDPLCGLDLGDVVLDPAEDELAAVRPVDPLLPRPAEQVTRSQRGRRKSLRPLVLSQRGPIDHACRLLRGLLVGDAGELGNSLWFAQLPQRSREANSPPSAPFPENQLKTASAKLQ